MNFLQIRLQSNSNQQTINFEYDKKNKLTTIFSNESFSVSTGLFDSKQEDTFLLDNDSTLFAYVVNGAFEYEGRLLENRDGICIWDEKKADFESLTYNGIIFILTLKK